MGVNKYWFSALLVLITAAYCQIASAAAAVFKELPLDKAKATAKDEGKILVVDFTASWCGPCHKMEADTWSNPTVQKWVNDNAIAVQVDVDKEQATSAAFQIQAMPSVVVFTPKDYAKEFDRHVGYLNHTEIMQWFSAVKNGETQLDVIKHAMEATIGKGGKTEIEARRKYGRACIENGKFDAALEQYIWLWQNLIKEDPESKTMRASTLSSEMTVLAKESPAARSRFQMFRDDALNENPLDFVVLNEVLNEPAKSLAWFEKIKKDPAEKENLKIAGHRLERLLIQKGMWADMYYLYPDPVEEVKLRSEVSKSALAALAKMGVHPPYDPFCMDSAKIYGACLAAHKDAIAKKVAAECLAISNTPLMKRQLVSAALQAKQPRKEQVKWAAEDKDIAKALDEALHPTKDKSGKKPSEKSGEKPDKKSGEKSNK